MLSSLLPAGLTWHTVRPLSSQHTPFRPTTSDAARTTITCEVDEDEDEQEEEDEWEEACVSYGDRKEEEDEDVEDVCGEEEEEQEEGLNERTTHARGPHRTQQERGSAKRRLRALRARRHVRDLRAITASFVGVVPVSLHDYTCEHRAQRKHARWGE